MFLKARNDGSVRKVRKQRGAAGRFFLLLGGSSGELLSSSLWWTSFFGNCGKRFGLYLRVFAVAFVLLLTAQGGSAQRFSLRLLSVDDQQSALVAAINPPEAFSGTAAAMQYLQQIVPRLQERGYLSASIDSMAFREGVYTVSVFLGHPYQWSQVNFEGIPLPVMSQVAMRREQWEGRFLHPKQVARLSEKLLSWAEDNGYPFARVWLEVTELTNEGKVRGTFKLDKGSLQLIDTIDVQGSVKVARGFLLSYLDLKQKQPYNEQKLRTISTRLRELPFLQEAAPWNMEFTLAQNKLNLFLKEKKANQLNAIVGLLPNSLETGTFLLTVDALFAFQNILGRGESISLSYQNLQYKSPRLRLDMTYPYLLNTPFGIDVQFDLFKKDTTFRRTSLQAGLRYQLTSTDYLRVFYTNQGNRLITVDTSFVKSNRRLPDNIDVSANGAGVEVGLNRTDYRLNPRRGWETKISASALIRAVRQSDAITGLTDAGGFNYAGLYDTLLQRRNQYFITGKLAWYVPLGKKIVFKPEYNGGWVGGQHLFRNELYQIGGFRLLRGFDEQSIFTNHYQVLTMELRLLLDQNSNFYLFSDNGYVESNFNGVFNSDVYNGFGMGATLQTRSGLFTISYALGRNSANSAQFRQSKVHFGYISYF